VPDRHDPHRGEPRRKDLGTVMGPLAGVTIIEMAGIGPAPFAGMMLADLGARLIRIDRREDADLGIPGRAPKFDVLGRGRASISLDLKADAGREIVLKLVATADGLIEGFRPGVLERLGLGPDVLLARNPRLVVGRMTGWGQTGPWADRAGHDIDYIAMAGALHAFGRKGQAPVPPLNLVGDFGGGGMVLVVGMLAGLLETKASGRGQVIDAAMVDGTATLMGMFYAMHSSGRWRDERGVNVLDTGAPWYDVYETKDGRHMAVGAIETKFYAELLERLGLAHRGDLPAQHDVARWDDLRAEFARVFKTRTQEEWATVFDGSDACVAPVLSLSEARRHPHMAARDVIVERDGVVQPAPSPRFSRTPGAIGAPPCAPGTHTDQVLTELGYQAADIAALKAARIVGRS
jgi:alpha-methylacyl-CoA racemase